MAERWLVYGKDYGDAQVYRLLAETEKTVVLEENDGFSGRTFSRRTTKTDLMGYADSREVAETMVAAFKVAHENYKHDLRLANERLMELRRCRLMALRRALGIEEAADEPAEA